jgi:hypothetical protein
VNAGQYEGIVGRLDAILSKMPAAPVFEPERPAQPATPRPRMPRRKRGPLTTRDQRESASLALYTLLTVLDGWIEGQRENHDAMGHRGENTGSECWREFAPSDFRRMVNDAARELGLSEFPEPTNPREDHVR